MMVSHRHRCVFAHVPKCAGTTVKRVLELEPIDPPYWHCTWEEAERALGRAVLASYFKFAIVRNPWDRLVSAWRMFLEKGWCRQDRSYTLPEFVALAIDESIPYRARYSDPAEQARWESTVENVRHHTLPCVHPYYGVVDAEGAVGMDEVIPYDALDAELGRVLRHLDVSVARLPRENATRHRHYSRYFDEQTRAIVETHFAADIRTFGFTFANGGQGRTSG